MRKLSLLLIFTTFAIVSGYARSFKYEYKNVTFKCNEDKGYITITSFDDDADVVTIPGSVNGMPVKKLSCFINGHNYMASEIIIEEGVEEIAKFCFNEFRKLQKVTVPSSLTWVRSNAFRKGNDIVFYGPDNFNAGLVKNYTSRPFNNKRVPYGQETLLAQQNADKKATNQKKEQARDNNNRFYSTISSALSAKKEKGSSSPQGNKAQQNTPLTAKDNLIPAIKERQLSDVDINIPRTQKVNESTFCFIIANEQYDELPTVNYAENDGNTFKKYCVDALGVPESQVFLYVNASYTSMTRALRKMENLAAATDGKSKFVFYYAGHGSASEENQSAFIVPSDGLVTVPSTCFALSDMYKRFGEMEAKSVVVLLDACFSGLSRDNSGLIAARAVARKPKKETVSGNVIVLSATSEAETAMSYDEKEHGMFTYHVLKKLQQSNGEVKFSDLFQAVSDGVRRDSIIKNDKNQTPSLVVSTKLKTTWENLYF